MNPNAGQQAQADWANLFSGMGFGQARPGVQAAGARLQEKAGFGDNPGALRMFAYAPADLAAGSPLVVVLHGCSQNAVGYDEGAGWSTLADRLGFAVLFPEQTPSNNGNGCFNWFRAADTRRDAGEAWSIRQMIATAVEDHKLDPRRIFITGLSAGGAMTSVMLATYPEVFAGGAIIAGLPYGAAANVGEAFGAMQQAPQRSSAAWGDLVREASPHRGPWPRVSVWHGDADTTVSPSNASAVVDQWLDVHGLHRTPSVQDRVNGYPRRVWSDASGTPVVESYTLTGMSHGTPIAAGDAEGGCGAARPFMLETGISSSYRIAQFWGLTRTVAPAAAADAAEAGQARSPRQHTPSAAAVETVRSGPAGRSASKRHVIAPPLARTVDPQKIIADALKAAGLLKK